MPVPCGLDGKVLIPLGAALGTTDEVATLVGHGPIEPDLLQAVLLNSPRLRAVFIDTNGVPVALGRRRVTPGRGDLQALLLNSPRLRAVFVDDNGVPVALGRRRMTPERGDPTSLRAALLDLAGSPPGRWFPRHPDDHPPPESSPAQPSPSWSAPHLPGTPGPYAVTGLLRELVLTRAPLCEFPGCGVTAELCDAEHDLAHPDGPTCSCNLGPCCRRHHRVKQQGWTKTRQHDSAVRWTSPTGRTWTSPSQHPPPAPPLRPLAPLSAPDPLDELSPTFADHELWEHRDRPDDPVAYELRAVDREPTDSDDVGELLTEGATGWTLDLDDPYAWTYQPARA